MAVKNKPPFKTSYDAQFQHERVHCEPGSRMKVDYQPVFDAKGMWHLEKTGEHDIYLDIQSFADSCDINILMARYRNGETDVLQQVQGTYGDFSGIPKNYADLMNAKITAERLFMSLRADVREKYGNSVEQFMAEIGTKEGYEKLITPEAVKDTVKPEKEVKPDES